MDPINPSIHDNLRTRPQRLRSKESYLKGILDDRDNYVLSECITLLESENLDHQKLALDILDHCHRSRSGRSTRIGITGSPGVGKSTFINSIAAGLADHNEKVAILAIDPSSPTNKGSILGDKTRMDSLIRDQSIFIRPSPSNLHLGGLALHTFESIILCEAAGYDVILIETVGVGQSEIEVSDHTDVTILLSIPGGGDSLQGIKKGIIEKADLIIVHKADGDTVELAKKSAKDLNDALHYRKDGQSIPVLSYSSLTEYDKDLVISKIQELTHHKDLREARELKERQWLTNMSNHLLHQLLEKRITEQGLNLDIARQSSDSSPFAALTYLLNNYSIDLKSK